MKIGNVSQTVLKRSVLKLLKTKRNEVMVEPSVEEVCSGISVDEKKGILFSGASVFGNEKDLGIYGIAKTLNDITSRGAEAIGVEVEIQLPPHAYESRLNTMMKYMESACAKENVQITRVKVITNPMVRCAFVHVTAIGSVEKDAIIQTSKAKAGQDIVLLNDVGTEGALRILDAKRDLLQKRFIPAFFTELENTKKQLNMIGALNVAISRNPSAIHQIGEGGVLAALWELGEAAKVGLEVDLRSMKIRQDVIEICEYIGVNPYKLSSTGSALIVVESGVDLVQALEKAGYQAAIIGQTRDVNQRVILNGEERRFLERPDLDGLWKIYEEQEN